MACTAGSSDAVDVVFRLRGKIHVEDMGDIRDVEPSCRDICCDEDGDLPGAELLEGILALALGAVPVDHDTGYAISCQLLLEPVCAVLGADKDDGLFHIRLL